MKTAKPGLTLALVLAAASAFAQPSKYAAPDAHFVSTKTRAEVIAELQQAQADGTYVTGGEEFPNQVPMAARNARNRAAPTESAGNKKASPAPNGG